MNINHAEMLQGTGHIFKSHLFILVNCFMVLVTGEPETGEPGGNPGKYTENMHEKSNFSQKMKERKKFSQ